MISLLKYLNDDWETARRYLREDLDHIEAAINQRWNATFGDTNKIKPAALSPITAGAGINIVTGVTTITINLTAPVDVTLGGTGTTTKFTKGSVIFAGTNGVYSQDNAKFFWDDTNFRLGIGTASPTYDLDVSSAAVGTIIRAANSNTIGISNFYMNNDSNHFILFQLYGSAFPGTFPGYPGINKAELGIFEYQSSNTFLIGTSLSTPIVFGTGRVEAMRIDSSQRVGIGVTTLSAQLHTSGTVRFANFGAGLAKFDASGNISSLALPLGVTSGGTGTATQFTQGSVIFAGAFGIYSQDNSQFFWDDTNFRLGLGTAIPAYRLHVVGPGGFTAGSLVALFTDNNSHDGANIAFGWTGAGVNNKYKAFNIDSNGFHIGHMTDALNASPTLDFTITNAGACKAETEMQSVLYDFGASTCHLKGDGGDGVLHLLDSGETTFSYILLGKTDATGVRIQFNASTGITLVNGNNSLFVALQCGNAVLNGTATKYNGVNTAGWGVPAIYGSGRATAQTGAVASVATYTVGAADGSFVVSANVNVTTSTTFSINVQVTYTDETNTPQTLTLNFQNLGGTLLTAITNVQGAGPYEGLPVHIRCKASTAITIKTSGTFTAVTYNVEGYITQIG